MDEKRASGYQVLDLRLKYVETEIKKLLTKLDRHIERNDDEHTKMEEGISQGASSFKQIEFMFEQISKFNEKNEERNNKIMQGMRDDIKAMGESNKKDKGWRDVVWDLIKVILMILGFILTGKVVL